MLVLEYLPVAYLMSVWRRVHSCYLVCECLLAVSVQELLPTNFLYVKYSEMSIHYSCVHCVLQVEWWYSFTYCWIQHRLEVSCLLFYWATGKSPCTHLYMRVGVSQIWSCHFGEDRNLLSLLGMKLWFIDHQTCNLVSTLLMLSWFPWYNELTSNTFKVL